MLRQMPGAIKPENRVLSLRDRGGSENARIIREHIDSLHALPRRSLWRLLLFLAISLAALQFRYVDLLAAVPAGIAEVLGDPPPAELIHLVLGITCVSSFILIPARAAQDPEAGQSWTRFWIVSAYYLLYGAGNSLEYHFPLVFAAGAAILLVEYAAVWLKTWRDIAAEKERLGRVL